MRWLIPPKSGVLARSDLMRQSRCVALGLPSAKEIAMLCGIGIITFANAISKLLLLLLMMAGSPYVLEEEKTIWSSILPSMYCPRHR